MKAPLLEAYEKGLRIIRTMRPRDYGAICRWIIQFRRMYDITRSYYDDNYVYLRTLEDELNMKVKELCGESKDEQK